MTINRLLQSKKSGSAMALVLIALVLLLVMGMSLLSLGFQSRAYAIRTISGIGARCAADAGLTKALFEMNEKVKVKPWNDSVMPEATDVLLPGCDALFSYTIAENDDGSYYIESTGNLVQMQETVNADLRLKGAFEYAIFAENDIELKNASTVNWFNNDDDEENLKIGTNSTQPGAIDVQNSANINGDVVVGPGGTPNVVISSSPGTNITGECYAAAESYDLTPITVPGYLESMVSQGTLTNSITIVGPMKYNAISLDNGKILTVDGPVVLYVTGDVTLDASAEVRIVDANTNPNASLIMYLGGDLEVKNKSAVNNLIKDATKLKRYGLNSCQSIDLMNNCNFYGAIYAPNADMVMKNSGDTFGAVVTKSFIQENSADFNYDAALRDVSMNDELVNFVISRWSE